MITSDPRAVCPAWCQEARKGFPCNGDHGRPPESYTPATAGYPIAVTGHHGAQFPALGVAIAQCDLDRSGVAIGVHVVGGDALDVQVDLTLDETLRFATRLLEAYRVVTAELRPCGFPDEFERFLRVSGEIRQWLPAKVLEEVAS